MTISDLLNAFLRVRGRLLLLRVPACAGQEDRARVVWREHQRGSEVILLACCRRRSFPPLLL